MAARARIRRHLTFANVVSVVALFVALGGGAYAAFHLPPDSVKSKNIVDGQVKSKDLDARIKAKSAGLPVANGPCGVANEWQSTTDDPVDYYRDVNGMVHLEGIARACGTAPLNIFTLPGGYRPRRNMGLVGIVNRLDPKVFGINQTGEVQALSNPGQIFTLYALSFRCGPAGQNGCP